VSRNHKYKRYSTEVKAAIAMTGRIDLLPHLEIPRTTALHWVKSGCDLITDPILESVVVALNDSKIEIDELKRALAEKESITFYSGHH
jgi:hypothetical protein